MTADAGHSGFCRACGRRLVITLHDGEGFKASHAHPVCAEFTAAAAGAASIAGEVCGEDGRPRPPRTPEEHATVAHAMAERERSRS